MTEHFSSGIHEGDAVFLGSPNQCLGTKQSRFARRVSFSIPTCRFRCQFLYWRSGTSCRLPHGTYRKTDLPLAGCMSGRGARRWLRRRPVLSRAVETVRPGVPHRAPKQSGTRPDASLPARRKRLAGSGKPSRPATSRAAPVTHRVPHPSLPGVAKTKPPFPRPPYFPYSDPQPALRAARNRSRSRFVTRSRRGPAAVQSSSSISPGWWRGWRRTRAPPSATASRVTAT